MKIYEAAAFFFLIFLPILFQRKLKRVGLGWARCMEADICTLEVIFFLVFADAITNRTLVQRGMRMSVTIRANMANYIENGTLFTERQDNGKRNTFFAGDTGLANAPIAQKRKDAQEKAMKVISDAWEADKIIDKSVEDRKKHYEEMLVKKGAAQEQLKQIGEQIGSLKKDYGISEESSEKDWPDEYRQRYEELSEQAEAFRKEIYDADKQMQDDTADIRAIAKERLKADPMLDAQKTADAIEAAANKEIIGMAAEEAKEHIDKKLEEAEKKAQEKAKEEEQKEEKLEAIRESKAMQEALIEGTKEAAEEAEARRRKNEMPELPFDELVKLTKVNSETEKAQKSLEEIKYSMNLLEADLKGIEVDEEI